MQALPLLAITLICFSCFHEATQETPHLSRNRRAAGVRHSTALGAGVFMRAIKVQVPGPVGVVVPPTALELSKGERGKRSTGKCVVWCASCASCQFGLLPGKPQHAWCQYVQMVEENDMRNPTEVQEMHACMCLCGKCSPRAKLKSKEDLWFCGLLS